MFCVVYAYAALGVGAFGGLVSDGKSHRNYKVLSEMDYGSDGYWNINLNDMPSGMMLMFQMLVVNNWMVFAEAYGKVGGAPSWIFFMTFYFVGVIAGAVPCANDCMRKLLHGRGPARLHLRSVSWHSCVLLLCTCSGQFVHAVALRRRACVSLTARVQA